MLSSIRCRDFAKISASSDEEIAEINAYFAELNVVLRIKNLGRHCKEIKSDYVKK